LEAFRNEALHAKPSCAVSLTHTLASRPHEPFISIIYGLGEDPEPYAHGRSERRDADVRNQGILVFHMQIS